MHDSALPVPRLLEVYEVAYLLKSSQETVRRLIREKKLAAVHLGTRAWRIRPVDLEAYIEARRVQIAEAERRLDRQCAEAARTAAGPNGRDAAAEE